MNKRSRCNSVDDTEMGRYLDTTFFTRNNSLRQPLNDKMLRLRKQPITDFCRILSTDKEKLFKKHSMSIGSLKEEEYFDDENPLEQLLDGETEEDFQMRQEALEVRGRGSTVIQIPDATIHMDLHTLFLNRMSQDERKGAAVDECNLINLPECDLAIDDNEKRSGHFTLFKNKGKRRGVAMGMSLFRDFKDFLEYLKSNLFETTENELSNFKGSHWSTIGKFCDCNVTDNEMAQQAGLSEQERLRFEALWELFYAEVTYLVDNLLVLQDIFANTLKHAKRYGFLTSVDETKLFANLQPLVKVTTDFATMLLRIFKECGAELSRSTEIIVKGFQEFPNLLTPQYSDYCLNYRQAIVYLKSIKVDENFAEFIKICENQSRCARRQLEDLLVSPFQHLTKYPLLLKAIRKRTPNDDQNHDLLSETISNLEDSIKSIEQRFSNEVNMARMREISASLSWPLIVENDNKFTLPDFIRMEIMTNTVPNILLEKKDRTLIQEGYLVLPENSKLEVYVFLFSDMFLMTKVRKKVKRPTLSQSQEEPKTPAMSFSRKKGSISESMANMQYTVYKQPILMDSLQSFDCDDQYTGVKNSFVVVQCNPFHQVINAYTFQALSEDLKQQWIKNIKKAKNALMLLLSKDIQKKVTENLESPKNIKMKDTENSAPFKEIEVKKNESSLSKDIKLKDESIKVEGIENPTSSNDTLKGAENLTLFKDTKATVMENSVSSDDINVSFAEMASSKNIKMDRIDMDSSKDIKMKVRDLPPESI